jgi:hypothetical protein
MHVFWVLRQTWQPCDICHSSTWVLPHAIPFTLHSSGGLTWQILTILGKLNFYMSSSVPLQKDLRCNFWNYFCCMYITPQSSANAARCHGYYKRWQIYILIVVTIPGLQSHYCHDYIVTNPLLSWFHCYNLTIVMIPLLLSRYCQNTIVIIILLSRSHCYNPTIVTIPFLFFFFFFF